MIVLGWLVLLCLALWATAGGIIIAVASLKLTGKFSLECVPFLLLASGLLYATYVNFPFVLALKP